MAGLIPFNRKNSDLMKTNFDGFQNMLDDFFADSWPLSRSLIGDTFKLDVQDNVKEYVVEAELPGVKKNEVNVSLDDGKLKITINRNEDIEDNGKNYIHRERRSSTMTRSIYLADTDPSGIKAKLEEGVLIITVPKVIRPDNSIQIEIE